MFYQKRKVPRSAIKRIQKAHAFVESVADEEKRINVCVLGFAISRLALVSTFMFQLLAK